MAEDSEAFDSKREQKQNAEMEKVKQFLTEEEVKSEYYMEMTVKLQSAQAKRIFRRTFDHIQTQMTAATLLTRKFGLRELSDENVNKITESIKQLSSEMNRDLEQANHLFNDIGLKNSAVTDDSVDLNIKITCPEGMAFMNLIRQLDNLTMKLKTLWMAGEIPLSHSEDRSHAWQVRIFKTADAIRALGQQAYIAADKKKDSDQKKTKAKQAAYKQRQNNNVKKATAV